MAPRARQKGLTLLGATVRRPTRKLETFPAPKRTTRVTFDAPEWTSLCPVTGQPDFCHVTVSYMPDKLCLESKAFKLYVQSFRSARMFAETIADRLHRDLERALAPLDLTVTVEQKPRGGIGIVAEARSGSADRKAVRRGTL